MTRPRFAQIQLEPASREWSQLWQVPAFLAGLGALLLVLGSIPFRGDPQEKAFDREKILLRRGLAKKSEPPETLLSHAENLLAKMHRYPDKTGEVCFLAGSTYLRLADEIQDEDRSNDYRAKALVHLEKADQFVVPAADRPTVWLRLGLLLLQKGEDLKRAIGYLEKGLEKGGDPSGKSYAYLVTAYLHLPIPDVEAALLANQKQLENITEEDEVLQQARVVRAELLFRKNQKQEALKVLERIGPSAPRNIRMQARFMQARLCEEEGFFRRAIPFWKELLEDPNFVPGGKARIYYSLGQCHFLAEPPEYEFAAQEWQKTVEFDSDESLAAAIGLGDLELLKQPPDVNAALRWWVKALVNVKSQQDFKNGYLEVEQIQARFEKACRKFLDQGDYQAAQQLAGLYRKVAHPGVAEWYLAQASETVAKRLLENNSGPEALQHFLTAGEAYEQGAASQNPGQQVELLWRSIQCYRSAQVQDRLIRVLEKFVQIEKQDQRLAESWILLAEAYTALGNKEKARLAYYKSIEYPETPFACRARYQLALEELELQNTSQAIAILEQNLGQLGAALDRKAHEKSLYLLGEILFQQKKYDPAYLRLKEATRQYPSHPKVWQARDQLGECYRRLAEENGRRIVHPTFKEADEQKIKLLQDQNTYFRKTQLKWQQFALSTYQSLADDLEQILKAKGTLEQENHILLPKALFSLADIFYEMNEIEEALRRYQNIQDQYRRKVEGLIASHRIWGCIGRVVSPQEKVNLVLEMARNSVTKLKDDLSNMKESDEAFKGPPGVWSKKQWEDWIRREVSSRFQPSTPMPRVGPVVPSSYQLPLGF